MIKPIEVRQHAALEIMTICHQTVLESNTGSATS